MAYYHNTPIRKILGKYDSLVLVRAWIKQNPGVIKTTALTSALNVKKRNSSPDDVVRLLLDNNATITDNHLFKAISNNFPIDIIKRIMKVASIGKYDISIAVSRNRVDVIKLLIDNGAIPNKDDLRHLNDNMEEICSLLLSYDTVVPDVRTLGNLLKKGISDDLVKKILSYEGIIPHRYCLEYAMRGNSIDILEIMFVYTKPDITHLSRAISYNYSVDIINLLLSYKTVVPNYNERCTGSALYNYCNIGGLVSEYISYPFNTHCGCKHIILHAILSHCPIDVIITLLNHEIAKSKILPIISLDTIHSAIDTKYSYDDISKILELIQPVWMTLDTIERTKKMKWRKKHRNNIVRQVELHKHTHEFLLRTILVKHNIGNSLGPISMISDLIGSVV